MDHWIVRAAAMHPGRMAVADVTYAQLLEESRAAAGALVQQGVSPRSRVALALAPGADFVAALHGCFLAGAVAVPIDPRLGLAERTSLLAGTAAVVDGRLDGPKLRAQHELTLDSIATVVHTSGTTSVPRAVALSFDNWLANALGSGVVLGLDLAERWLCPLPLAHVGGLSILVRSAVYGTTVVLHERFDVGEVLAALSDPAQRITLVSLVPTMLARLLDAGLERPPALRWALLGGGPIPPGMVQRARAAGVPVAPTYGMTEACSQIATHGWPLPGVDVRIAPDGEILAAAPTIAAGAIAPDGWLHTGDLGSFDARGRLTIIGRKSDTIVTGGENVAPAEVEAVLLEHPAVADAGVHGRPDLDWGEAVVATVVLRDGLSAAADELLGFCAGRLARYKVPKSIEFVTRLPRTESGKLLRRRLM